MLRFVWLCFRPEQRRPQSDTRYNYELWGPQFTAMAKYFKDPARQTAGTIEELYRELQA